MNAVIICESLQPEGPTRFERFSHMRLGADGCDWMDADVLIMWSLESCSQRSFQTAAVSRSESFDVSEYSLIALISFGGTSSADLQELVVM